MNQIVSCHQRKDDVVVDVKRNNRTTNSASLGFKLLCRCPLTGGIVNQQAMTELLLTDTSDAHIKASDMEAGQGCL